MCREIAGDGDQVKLTVVVAEDAVGGERHAREVRG